MQQSKQDTTREQAKLRERRNGENEQRINSTKMVEQTDRQTDTHTRPVHIQTS